MQPKDWNKIEKLLGGLADQETVDEILKLMGQGVFAQCVKNIQYQVATVSASSKEFTISEVNHSRSLVIINSENSYTGGMGNSLLEFTDTTVKVGFYNNSGRGEVSIQVIEFY